MVRACVSAAMLLALAGCGFHPVYAPGSDGALGGVAGSELAAIDVALMPERSGQILRQDVQERLERFGVAATKRYKLTIALSFTQDQAGVLPDSTTTFTRVHGNADWRLTRLDAQSALVTSGTVRAIDGFNQLDEQVFASDLERESVQEKLSRRIADEIALQLGVYFKQHDAASPPA